MQVESAGSNDQDTREEIVHWDEMTKHESDLSLEVRSLGFHCEDQFLFFKSLMLIFLHV